MNHFWSGTHLLPVITEVISRWLRVLCIGSLCKGLRNVGWENYIENILCWKGDSFTLICIILWRTEIAEVVPHTPSQETGAPSQRTSTLWSVFVISFAYYSNVDSSKGSLLIWQTVLLCSKIVVKTKLIPFCYLLKMDLTNPYWHFGWVFNEIAWKFRCLY